jgi:hypothetical protein
MAEYKDVLIAWHDEPEVTYMTKVCIDSQWAEREDDVDVFFYFTSLDELEQAKLGANNGFEFRIMEDN